MSQFGNARCSRLTPASVTCVLPRESHFSAVRRLDVFESGISDPRVDEVKLFQRGEALDVFKSGISDWVQSRLSDVTQAK